QPQQKQQDLSALTAEEAASEEVLFEATAKIMEYKKGGEDDGHGGKTVAGWANRGQGPLRVLRNAETEVVRLLMRTPGQGQVVVNSRLVKEVTYKKVRGKTAQIAVVNADGGLTSLMVRAGSDEKVETLCRVCEEHKPAL
ncbi:MAG: hypothetical protein Q9157_007675, partial [Trypethelium eluteriae]